MSVGMITTERAQPPPRFERRRLLVPAVRSAEVSLHSLHLRQRQGKQHTAGDHSNPVERGRRPEFAASRPPASRAVNEFSTCELGSNVDVKGTGIEAATVQRRSSRPACCRSQGVCEC